MVNFCFDRFENGMPYPNYAVGNYLPGSVEWKSLSTSWPYAEPMHFLEYLDREKLKYNVYTVEEAPLNSLYPVSLSFFDFSLNWFTMLWDRQALVRIRNKEIKIWFLYSEADNPFKIKKHLEKMAIQEGIDPSQILFTSANSSARLIDNFSYFADDELLYQLRNQTTAVSYHENKRSKKFTALVRTHKPWRANTMAKLWQMGLNDHSYFSYNTQCAVEDLEVNPLEKSVIDADIITHEFLQNCPFYADNLSTTEHNSYETTVENHHSNSYCNIVIETHFDTERSGGVFLTEKTFKPLKHAQLFVIIGTAGSIQQLRSMGYKTFDHAIDHSYDKILDNNHRWEKVLKEIQRLNDTNLHELYLSCKDDIIHNQKLFLSSKANRLNTLLQKVTNE
jgi:hypothetical protein